MFRKAIKEKTEKAKNEWLQKFEETKKRDQTEINSGATQFTLKFKEDDEDEEEQSKKSKKASGRGRGRGRRGGK